MASGEFGIITVCKPGTTKGTTTKLHFTRHKVYQTAKRELERNPNVEVTDTFWGYALCDSVARAVEFAEFWCR